ncbi:hypothetical protein GCM10007416_34650 [Kroppenstedtia guangzhouensis]|uniref:Transposase DDE domain-containing protein n=2 Tax=Kroppenstedtia guangzhouensis TaxID=1274356 RepID=A0ABQ1H4I8_9BACL|nr:hypothetical protein GCM10007416_34650 [Kroppenstedtia guangzhouensis]
METKLSFLAHYVADTPSGVILAAEATLATGKAETEAGRRLLEQVQGRLLSSKSRRELVADGGYSDKSF